MSFPRGPQIPAAPIVLLLLVLIVCLRRASDVAAVALLPNGGFEQGSAGWSGSGFSTAGCAPQSGNDAGNLSAGLGRAAFVQQTLAGYPGAGSFSLSGYARLASGSGTLTAAILWQFADGSTNSGGLASSTPGATYAAFHVSTSGRADATGIVVRISFSADADAGVCLDDLGLDGPAFTTPTPTATPTITPSPTATPTLLPGATAVSTAAASASASRTPTTSATPSPTRTASATAIATPPPAPPDFSFRNGGFEAGLTGWDKYGGDLRAVTDPKRSGSGAAAFTSSTTSTKWAFEVVQVDPALAYEFQGYLLAGSGVSRAYLRISWYAATDGSGSALATDDSTADAALAGSAFGLLTTGPRTPPATARSARLRVMLTPAGAAVASLYLDDFALIASQPAANAPPPTTQVAPDEPVEAPATPTIPAATAPVAASATPAPAAGTTPQPVATPARQASTAPSATPVLVAVAAEARRTTLSPTPVPPAAIAGSRSAGHSTLLLIVAGLPVAALAGGGAFVWGKRRRG